VDEKERREREADQRFVREMRHLWELIGLIVLVTVVVWFLYDITLGDL
jgi:cell division septal protein FtsQ